MHGQFDEGVGHLCACTESRFEECAAHRMITVRVNTGNVGVLPPYEVPCWKYQRNNGRCSVFEATFSASYAKKYSYLPDGMLLRFAKIAYKRYLSLATDLHAPPSLGEKRRLGAEKGDEENVLDVTDEMGGRDSKGLLTAEELDRAGVQRKLRAVQDACRTERMKLPVSVIEFLDLGSEMVVIRKKWASLAQVIAQMIEDVRRLREELDNEMCIM